MNKINPEVEALQKKIEDLTLFAERQQGVLELYRKRFARIKHCLFNPFSAPGFIWDYYKKKNWRKFYKAVSPKEYTGWIQEKEDEYLELQNLKDIKDKELTSGYTLIKGKNIELNSFTIALINKILESHPEIDFIYGDEDFLDKATGMRSNPYFKPDFSPDTLLSFNYIGDFCVLKEGMLSNNESDSENIYDIVLKATEKSKSIYHIPMVLYHRITSSENLPSDKVSMDIFAKESAILRRGINATLENIPEVNGTRVVYDIKNEPKVSVIIPSKDNLNILSKCLESLFSKTVYKKFEVILIDNGSENSNKEKIEKFIFDLKSQHPQNLINYIYNPMEFNFSKMCNIGAEKSTGEYLLFLNDDIEIINGIYMERMLGAAIEPHIGAVGAKLLYPGGNIIQHDGVVDMANGPVHALHFGDDSIVYYHGRNRFDFNCIAVTGAALMVSRDKFMEVNGFNEEMAVGFNDIDLCYKLFEKGYYNLIRNDAVLFHHESISRGEDHNNKKKHKRLLKEQHLLNMSHPAIIAGDPFYSPLLTQTNTDYSPAMKEF